MIVFPEKLKALRTAKKLSQDALAEELFISRQAISKQENGEATPDLVTLVKLADLFDVSLDELVTGKRPDRLIERIIEKEPAVKTSFYDFLSNKDNKWIIIVAFVLIFFAIMQLSQ